MDSHHSGINVDLHEKVAMKGYYVARKVTIMSNVYGCFILTKDYHFFNRSSFCISWRLDGTDRASKDHGMIGLYFNGSIFFNKGCGLSFQRTPQTKVYIHSSGSI
jgi:hypothetical protein